MSDTSESPKEKYKLLQIVLRFMATESSGGFIMILCAVLAMFCANSFLAERYNAFTTMPITFGAGADALTQSLSGWVKDVLMVLFFLVVGMELKREISEGLLSHKGQVILPLLAAVGGMLCPALLFFLINIQSPESLRGWAIPSATDIAFALCILSLFGKSMPSSAKILLLAIAIFDDLGAIILIAVFYNAKLVIIPLLLAALGLGVLALLNRCKISAITPYILTGIYLWFCLHYSGIHTTIAGVAVGMAIPLRCTKQAHNSPLNHCMHMLHPWVSFGILPLFAFTSAGIGLMNVTLSDLLDPLTLGITFGLFLGKPIGICGAIFLLVKSGFARLPEGTGWKHVYAVSVIAGAGFTMSLFISLLAFASPHLQEIAKIGVISGSLLSVIFGSIILLLLEKETLAA